MSCSPSSLAHIIRACVLFILCLSIFAGCSDDPVNDPAVVIITCGEGETRGCTCDDGSESVQTCRSQEFGTCACAVSEDAGFVDGGEDVSTPDATTDSGQPTDTSGQDTADSDDTVELPDDAGSDGGPDTGEACVDGATRCGDTSVEECVAGVWQVDASCALGCEAGQCVDAAAACIPGQTRCYRSSVQRCNREGTAWLYEGICLDGCDEGLCIGRCSAGEYRCNGDVREQCNGAGDDWTTVATCALGCMEKVCVETSLELPGTVVELSGIHVYEGCVDITLAGTLRVAPGEELEIHARCLNISESSRIEVGSGSSLRIYVTEDATIAGTVSQGSETVIEALGTLTLSGPVQSARTTLRADELIIAAGGSTSGSQFNAALFGSSYSSAGTHLGIVSVMPPRRIESSTHPAGPTWNLAGDEVVVTWDRPFDSVLGYYVAKGTVLPGPGQGTLRTTESMVFPLSDFGPGENRVRVVSVNADSVVGTHFEEVVINFNIRGPEVSSLSHENDNPWGGVDDVSLSWTDPADVPAETFRGYFYVWDRQADTVPGPENGTFDDRRTRLLIDQEPGVWFFHIVNIDRLGRTSPSVGRYKVRIGPDPGLGNIAGTITDAGTGAPIAGATVLLNGGLERTRTSANGDYTFSSAVVAAVDPYRVTARARGYETKEASVQVAAGAARVQDFSLSADPGDTSPFLELGWEVLVRDISATNPSVAMGPAGRFIWARTGRAGIAEDLAIHDFSGRRLRLEPTLDQYDDYPQTHLGWNGERFHAIDNYRCSDNGSLNSGHGWSCLQMRTWDKDGAVTGGWLRWRHSGQTSAPSAAFNGTTYGTFFISYTSLYFREVSPNMTFTNGDTPTTHTLLSSGHFDSRSATSTATVWDGSGYATAWSIGRSPTDSTHTLFFARWDRSLNVLQARIEVDEAHFSNALGLVWDGTRYHLLYHQRDGANRNLVLRAVESDGSLSARTVVMSGANFSTVPALAIDDRHLLLAFEPPSTGVIEVEVRRVDDHSLVERYEVEGSAPRISVDAQTGDGVLLYLRGGNTWIRSLATF